MTVASQPEAKGAQATGGPVVEMSDVSFAYGRYLVLEDVNLRVSPGEFVGVIGPNGGGKTTLMKLILGLLKPLTGRVRVFGGSPEAARPRIGYMPQYARFDPDFPVSVLDVVLMGRVERVHFGGYRRMDREAAGRALREVDLEGFDRRSFVALSGGQRQRVLIARALATEPDLLLLDEPTANLDRTQQKILTDLLIRLSERLTILLVSHEVGFVTTAINTVICVNRDAVVHPTSDLTGDAIRKLFGSDMRMVRHDHRCAEAGHEREETT